MDQSERDEINEPSAKYMKLDNGSVREEIDGDAVVSHQNQLAKILKVNIDCLEEVFDYLTEFDLFEVGNTCKRLQQVVGYFYNQYFKRHLRSCLLEDIRKTLSTEFLVEFAESFTLESESDYKYLLVIQPRLHRIKEIDFLCFDITSSKLLRMRDILKNVEKLWILKSSFDGNLHDDVLAYCPNLKKLYVRDVDELNENPNIGSDWTLQKYPKLEYFMWSAEKMSGLTNFLELNPNIRTFVTAYDDLWANRNIMMTAKFSLNTLGIDLRGHNFTMLFARLLQKLHMRGVYKRLKLYFHHVSSQETIGLLASLNVPIVCLKIVEVGEDLIQYQLSDLIHLEEISIENSNRVTNIEAMANNLTRLERIFFGSAGFNDILPLICRAANLRKITIMHLEEGIHFDATTKVINFSALKKMREKLAAAKKAKKVILYVKEDIYLINKWTHRKTDFGVIRIMRTATCDRSDFI